ncbi:MAG: phosphatase domain-containing protein [Synechococcales bacterium]|nr:phosphatase domain-containing protein [Synechococcales bacterium]
MTDWIHLISEWSASINRVFDQAKRQVKTVLGIEDPLQILPYRGYGTRDRLYFMGRVLRDEGIRPGSQDTPIWENALNMFRRFESDEVPGARLRLNFENQQQELVTDQEGYFRAEVRPQELPGDRLRHQATVELLDPQPRKKEQVRAIAEAIAPLPTAKFGVISDIDDTIVHTQATDLLQMLWVAYLGNARTRLPFPGVAKFYQALQAGQGGHEGNPVFYVSSSALNMYDVFEEFMDLHELPAGALFLREMELSLENWLSFSHEGHKRSKIEAILECYPDLPFILIGDSGQEDAEIYRRLVHDYPHRVQCIYIRNVSQQKPKRQKELEAIAQDVQSLGSPFIIVPDTLAAAQHAADQGWIVPSTLSEIEQNQD